MNVIMHLKCKNSFQIRFLFFFNINCWKKRVEIWSNSLQPGLCRFCEWEKAEQHASLTQRAAV